MEIEIDHYLTLGLPSGEEGARLSEKEISKAYRLKALELHPDKRPDDPNAQANFQKLRTSYEILKDEKARKYFDDLIRIRGEKIKRQSHHDSKRRKMMSDLEERERAAFSVDPELKAREEEDRISRKLKDEISRIRSMFSNKASSTTPAPPKNNTSKSSQSSTGDGSRGSTVDKGKVLKVSWGKVGEDYSAQRLREIFHEFGEVEDVVIKNSKKRGSALVVMASNDSAVAAVGNVLGSLSNPLLVLPLKPAQTASSPIFSSGVQDGVEPDEPKLDNIVGAGYQAFEDSVLEKLRKAAQKQK